MTKTRLEAFSDGVIAILITILVLELKIPHGADWEALRPLAPVFLTYVLSFVFLGIYWNNHHHLLHTVDGVNGRILWANLHLLFWLSLIPFVTGWMGENHFAPLPTGDLRRRAALRGHRVLHPGPRDHRPAGPALEARGRSRQGRQGHRLSGPLRRRDRIDASSIRRSRRASTSWSRSCGWSPIGGSSRGCERP